MTKIIKIFTLLAVILGFLTVTNVAYAQQNVFTTTTIAVAIVAPGTTNASITTNVCFQVASATGINAPTLGTNGGFGGSQSTLGTVLYIDREAIQVQSVSGTTVCGWRGWAGTRVTAHLINTLVWIGNPEWYSNAAVGSVPNGTCSASSLFAYPDIHILDGTIWACAAEGMWAYAGYGLDAYGAPNNRTAVADAAYTAKVWDSVIAYTSLSATRAVTLPAANSVPGKIYTITDESGNGAADNITIANSGAHCLSVTANYGQTMCRSNGSIWLTF